MRTCEHKVVTEIVTKNVTVKRICDNCHKEIQMESDSKYYNYFHVSTHHNDWGNDSCDSYMDYDACCPDCAIKMAEIYLKNAYKQGSYNTKEINIEHVCSLEDGTNRDYSWDIASD